MVAAQWTWRPQSRLEQKTESFRRDVSTEKLKLIYCLKCFTTFRVLQLLENVEMK